MDKVCLNTGISALNRVLEGGYKQGGLVVIVGAAGLGKTSFLVQGGLAQDPYPGIFYDCTQSENPQPILEFVHNSGHREVRLYTQEDRNLINSFNDTDELRNALILTEKTRITWDGF